MSDTFNAANNQKNRSILELTCDEARAFFLKQASYCSIDFPPYFVFDDLLSSVRKELDGKNFRTCKKKSHGIPKG